MGRVEQHSSGNNNVIMHDSLRSPQIKSSQKIEVKKRKYVRKQASAEQSTKRAKMKSQASVKGVIDPAIAVLLDNKLNALRKNLENEIETVMESLKMEFIQCITEETSDQIVAVQNPKSPERRKGKRGSTGTVISFLNINQENVPWVTHRTGSYSKRSKTSGQLLKLLQPVLVERTLTPNEDKLIRSFFHEHKDLGDQEFSEKIHGVHMRVKDILSLSPRGWLTGEVLFAYSMIIKQMMLSTIGKQTVHIEDSYFMYFLLKYYKEYCSSTEDDSTDGHYAATVRKRLSPEILGYNPAEMLILIPMNQRNKHWTLAVVDPTHARIYILDSMYSLDYLQKTYAEEIMVMQTMLPIALWHSTELGYSGVRRKWKAFVVDDIPKQKNTFDCGVFVIAYMDMIARGKAIHFDPNLSVTKRVICRDILKAANAL